MPPQHSRPRAAPGATQTQESPFESRRRTFYFWSNAVAFPAAIYGFINSVGVQRPALLFVVLETLVSLYLLRRNFPLWLFERTASLGLALFSLLFLGGALFAEDRAVWTHILERSYWLYFLTLVVMHLLVTDRAAWRASLIYSSFFVILVLCRIWPSQTGGDWAYLTSLGSFAFIATATAVLLNVFGSYREQLVRERILASTDALTGVFNRRPTLTELERLSQARTAFVVILFDVDHFKRFNDRFGHFAGDEALVRLARLSESEVGRQGLVSRWGGEEFLIVLESFSEAQGAALAEQVRLRLEQSAQPGEDPITASFGVAAWSGGEAYSVTLTRADQALYRAKREGRNCVVAASSLPADAVEPARAESAA